MVDSNRKKALRILRGIFILVTVALLVTLMICAVLHAGELEIYLPDENKAADYRPDSNLVEVRPSPAGERRMIVSSNSRMPGKVFIENPNGRFEYVRVLPGGILYDMSRGNFSGSREATTIIQIYVLTVTLLSAFSLVFRCKFDLFSYSTLYMGGSMLFLSGLSLDLLLNVIRLWLHPDTYFMLSVYSSLKGAANTFMLLTLPFMLLVACSLVISNISLIRHEGKRFSNMLAVIMSALIVVGYIGYFVLDNTFVMGSELQMRIYGTVTSVYTTAFVYLEAMLISAMMCGFISAGKKPSYDRTHMIILGCAIASDGTPLPLLRGRIDKALDFAKEQRRRSGIGIRFVPSGGKGPDEIMAEAEAMEQYLVSKGVDADDILPETKSANTKENMRFSLEKIRADSPGAKIAFSTSGYHVLRSGMISREEGLDAEGIGCRTKWYFWPNAFIREFVGLIAGKWKEHVFWILFFVGIFSLINMIMPM
ncbi:MAG: YdcF family protein [Oscillospiraceae bacterium]|nr:YdcF family protein [Oscillospiraceae bacterium]MBR4896566.1 YdcF family protein [Clostridia bacterium]